MVLHRTIFTTKLIIFNVTVINNNNVLQLELLEDNVYNKTTGRYIVCQLAEATYKYLRLITFVKTVAFYGRWIICLI